MKLKKIDVRIMLDIVKENHFFKCNLLKENFRSAGNKASIVSPKNKGTKGNLLQLHSSVKKSYFKVAASHKADSTIAYRTNDAVRKDRHCGNKESDKFDYSNFHNPICPHCLS
jgi:hypothetical protein